MARPNRTPKQIHLEGLPAIHPNAAGIDIGANEMVVAVPADRDPQPVRAFPTFTWDLQALVAQEAGVTSEEHWQLVTMSQASGMGEKPHAKVVLKELNVEKRSESQGDGPVDATFKAIEGLAQSGAELLLYSVNAVTQGTESQGEVTVRLAKGGRIVNGVGADTDIVVASAKAYISALNKLASKVERLNPQHQL